MEFVPVLAMAAITLKALDFIRYLRAGDTNGVITQLASWIISIVLVVLVANTAWASGIAVGDQNLDAINIWSLLFVGLAVGSGASVIKDIGYKALDNTNSAAIPTLLASRSARADGPRDVG